MTVEELCNGEYTMEATGDYGDYGDYGERQSSRQSSRQSPRQSLLQSLDRGRTLLDLLLRRSRAVLS